MVLPSEISRGQTKDRTSYYDGYLYEKIVARQQIAMNKVLTKYVSGDNSSVLEVGCGTGILSFMLAKKCNYVVGVDLSSKMISYANKKKEAANYSHVEFIHTDASKMSEFINRTFDYATMVMFLHETEEELREQALREALKLAKKIIICDFSSPVPKGMISKLLVAQEFVAGVRHFRNFRNWMDQGGIDGFLKKINANIESEREWKNKVGKIVTISK
jgi:ubiquinone/menaquinone biosynthesis C-methylase UbiE